ncbi:uncharacterized protein LOC143356343 [Halictus rubicundus]|uniref:uncharacterized protein LOC143356343 n=1 Tax=Halictus rubicundus TaxID=77578 RepID=UPI00403606DE
MRLLALICLWTILSTCQGYRILGLFPFNGKSHFMMFESLMKGLAKKGHQVDVISTFPLKKPHPNYKDIIVLSAPRQFINNMTFDNMNSMLTVSVSHAVATLAGTEVCASLSDPRIQEFVRNPPKDPPYDAVLVEVFGAHCYFAIGYLLKAPMIGVSSAILYPWHYDMVGTPENLAYTPNNLITFPSRMNFWQRTYNFLHSTFHKWSFQYYSSPQTEIARKYLGDDIPDVRTLERNISMVLTNSFMGINGVMDMNPAFVEVGGLHVQEEGVELPASLEKWMNESTNGFIYFSFGSMVKIESFPMKYLEIFYKSLGKIAPVRVLMKIPKPNELPPGLPKNIHTSPWIPQVKVLKHPNIKAFITHGGLMGTQESIHYGVPLIGIPLFADQFINIDNYVKLNIAIGLDLNTLTEEKMDNALNAVLHDPKYRETAKKMSAKFLDRPLSALDTAIYWIEYIIRNGGDALRSPAMDMAWYQVQLLDVYLFVLTMAGLAVYIAIRVLRFAFGMISVDQKPYDKRKVSANLCFEDIGHVRDCQSYEFMVAKLYKKRANEIINYDSVNDSAFLIIKLPPMFLFICYTIVVIATLDCSKKENIIKQHTSDSNREVIVSSGNSITHACAEDACTDDVSSKMREVIQFPQSIIRRAIFFLSARYLNNLLDKEGNCTKTIANQVKETGFRQSGGHPSSTNIYYLLPLWRLKLVSKKCSSSSLQCSSLKSSSPSTSLFTDSSPLLHIFYGSYNVYYNNYNSQIVSEFYFKATGLHSLIRTIERISWISRPVSSIGSALRNAAALVYSIVVKSATIDYSLQVNNLLLSITIVESRTDDILNKLVSWTKQCLPEIMTHNELYRLHYLVFGSICTINSVFRCRSGITRLIIIIKPNIYKQRSHLFVSPLPKLTFLLPVRSEPVEKEIPSGRKFGNKIQETVIYSLWTCVGYSPSTRQKPVHAEAANSSDISFSASSCVRAASVVSLISVRPVTTIARPKGHYDPVANLFLKMRLRLLTILVALTCCHFGSGVRILGVFPLNGRSHWMMSERLMVALAERGHQVDVITHFPMKKALPPNYSEINIADSLEAIQNNLDAKTAVEFNKMNFDILIDKAGIKICDLLTHKNIQRVIKNPPNDPPYDLVVTEVFMSPCYLAFGRHLKVPMVSIITAAFLDWLEDVTGNPHNPAFMPNLFVSFNQPMSFSDRLSNTLLTHYVSYQINSRMERMSHYVRDHFGIDTPVRELHKDIALYLINSHHSINGITPTTTAVVEVGGLHVTENGDPLSPEVKKWLDESKHGCIYVTFGSMVRIETFPKPVLDAFYTVFEKIAPVRVLMKIAKKEDLPPGLPKNVMVQPWFPQVTVFKHKNVKAFITHGGLMSFQEAVYFGIPLIGIPIFGDQHTNMKNAVTKKLAVSLGSPDNVTVETLSYAIDKVLNDDEYRTNMKRVSTLFKDRPMKPLDEAVYWVEYVAKHGNILQSPAIHLTWWQQKLVDVYAFILVCLVTALAVVVFVLRKLTRLLLGCKSCSKKDTKTSESKKRK